MPTSRLSHRVEPDVTPMIDVLLVLLVAFMVVSPALIPCFSARLPETQNFRAHKERAADQTLGIDLDGTYYLNKRPIRNDALPGMLSAIFSSQSKDRVLYIKADRGLSYSKVLDALDIARQNGALVAGMISEKASQSNAGRRSR